ncbi:hypothetical protein Cflav_PD0009 [Pedosphaera parvula Ellin514]|uniref:Uncharacterized protein n=1 Tax=Pedosphaera parvula (strain Ellin514) TaxID=320771 RepID=B9XT47_PEDPL|nr:hypothetical protein Cflav_PD0009 [Pedosphaera parvula Ellin514]
MKWLSRLLLKIKIRRALARADGNSPEVRHSVKLFWASASVLYRTAVGPTAIIPIELAALQRLCEQPQIAELFFVILWIIPI